MATVSMASASTRDRHQTVAGNVHLPYLAEFEIDLAKAAVAKGSALANGDIIEAIRIPAGTVVLFGGFEVKTAVTGGSTDITVTLGDGLDADRWVATFDLDAAVKGAHAPIVIATANPTVFGTSDTIDLVFTAGTTIPTAGVVRVYAMMVDVNDAMAPGLVRLGS